MLEVEFFIGISIGIFIISVYLLKKSFYRVEEGHLAVVTEFGKVEMKDEKNKLLKTYGPGLHWKWPWKKYQVTSMMERNLDLSGEAGGITTMAEDGTILRLDSKLRYAPLEKELYTYLFVMKNATAHIKGLFTCLLRNEIANFGSKFSQSIEAQDGSYAQIRRERRLLNQSIANFCQDKISERYGGIKFYAVDLIDILPPDELAEALNAVINTQTEAEMLFAHAEANCQQRILSAERGVAIAMAQGKACEREILTLAEFLLELQKNGTLQAYVERRRTEVLADSKTVFRRNSQ
jgi:regulator of protease activity HflC (stomatin/prohibitin superfamily)